jgi:hypothetical protein
VVCLYETNSSGESPAVEGISFIVEALLVQCSYECTVQQQVTRPLNCLCLQRYSLWRVRVHDHSGSASEQQHTARHIRPSARCLKDYFLLYQSAMLECLRRTQYKRLCCLLKYAIYKDCHINRAVYVNRLASVRTFSRCCCCCCCGEGCLFMQTRQQLI